jgi:hypothetical protein
MAAIDDGAWFAPKRYGLGAGAPIAWQGWVMVAAHIALVALGWPLLRHHPGYFAAHALIFGLIPLPLYAAKTRGGWRWRWGGGD